MDKITCQQCAFWARWPDQPSPHVIVGDCRRHAPQVFPMKERFLTKFPSTKIEDFCGSFKPKQDR